MRIIKPLRRVGQNRCSLFQRSMRYQQVISHGLEVVAVIKNLLSNTSRKKITVESSERDGRPELTGVQVHTQTVAIVLWADAVEDFCRHMFLHDW